MCESVFIETPRMIVKKPDPLDYCALRVLQKNPDVMAFFGGPRDDDKIVANFVKLYSHFQNHGFSFGLVFIKESLDFVGRAGLVRLDFDDKSPDIEFGCFLLKPYWGKGLATELGNVFIRYAFEKLGLERVYATIDPENVASIRVCEKLGMSHERTADYASLDKRTHFYIKSRDS